MVTFAIKNSNKYKGLSLQRYDFALARAPTKSSIIFVWNKKSPPFIFWQACAYSYDFHRKEFYVPLNTSTQVALTEKPTKSDTCLGVRRALLTLNAFFSFKEVLSFYKSFDCCQDDS